jgi:hypothetical protein
MKNLYFKLELMPSNKWVILWVTYTIHQQINIQIRPGQAITTKLLHIEYCFNCGSTEPRELLIGEEMFLPLRVHPNPVRGEV